MSDETTAKIRGVWYGMKSRCRNKEDIAYDCYGGRGICVCDDWDDFEIFMTWAVENGYNTGLEIDRRDNDGNYEPSNCRWVTHTENSRNRRTTMLTPELVIELRDLYASKTLSTKEIAKKFGITNWHVNAVVNRKRWADVV